MAEKHSINVTTSMEKDLSDPLSRPKKGLNVENEVLQNLLDLNSNIDRVYLYIQGLKQDVNYQKNAQGAVLEAVTNLNNSLNDMNKRLVVVEEDNKSRPCSAHQKSISENNHSIAQIDKKVAILEATSITKSEIDQRLAVLETTNTVKDKDEQKWMGIINNKTVNLVGCLSLIVAIIGLISGFVIGIIQLFK